MSTLAVARLELRRLAVRPLAWALAALTIAWLAWTFILGLGQFLGAQVKLAAVADAPGFTDLVAIPLLAELAKLAFLVVPLMTMTQLAGERRSGTLALLASTGLAPWHIVIGKYLAVLVCLGLWLLATVRDVTAPQQQHLAVPHRRLSNAQLGKMRVDLGALLDCERPGDRFITQIEPRQRNDRDVVHARVVASAHASVKPRSCLPSPPLRCRRSMRLSACCR